MMFFNYLSLMPFKYYGIFSYTFVTGWFHNCLFNPSSKKNQPIPLNLHFHCRHLIPISVHSSEMYFLVTTQVSRVTFAKSQRPHCSAYKMEILLSMYFTPGLSHISQVLCACIIEKSNAFTEQQATWQVGTFNCPFPVMGLKVGTCSFQPLVAPINCTLSTVEILIQIWVFPNTYSRTFLLFPI